MWQELIKYQTEFINLKIDKVVDYDRFNRIAVIHHSSAMEGSTLTLEETTALVTEGITAKGKPLSENQMVNDHYLALLFCLEESKKKTAVSVNFLKLINSLVNKNTGSIRNTPMGICDDTKGDFRLGNVRAGNSYFVNYDKVPALVNKFAMEIEQKMMQVNSPEEIYKLSFDAHFNLVSIHPWFDGNGRTSRLLMNYIQACFNLPLAIVFIENKPDYYKALTTAREVADINIFRDFMCSQMIKYFITEIEKYKKSSGGFSFLF